MTNAEFLDQLVKQLKSESPLPDKMDNYTTLTDITAENNTIIFKADMNDFDFGDLSQAEVTEILKEAIITQGVCGDKHIFDRNISVKYIYTDLTTDQIYTVVITKADC